MKILLTGATGYIGKRLLPILVTQVHEIICCVRDKNRFYCPEEFRKNVTVVEVDFLEIETLTEIPTDIDAAYYLIHSMSGSENNYDELEKISAENFVQNIDKTNVKHVIYLSGIVNDKSLSKHLASRKKSGRCFEQWKICYDNAKSWNHRGFRKRFFRNNSGFDQQTPGDDYSKMA